MTQQRHDLRQIAQGQREGFLEARRQDGQPFLRDDGYYIFPDQYSIAPKRYYPDWQVTPDSLAFRSEMIRKGHWPKGEPVAYVKLPKKAHGDIGALYDKRNYVTVINHIGQLEKTINEKDRLIAELSDKLERLLKNWKDFLKKLNSGDE